MNRLHNGIPCTGLGGPDAKLRRHNDIRLLTSTVGRGENVGINDYSVSSPLFDSLMQYSALW